MVSVVVFFLWFALAETAVITETRGYNSGSFALIFALSLLVISCPCAFGLAAPVAIMVAAGVAAKLGIFFKGGESFENLARVTAVVFDKTGNALIAFF